MCDSKTPFSPEKVAELVEDIKVKVEAEEAATVTATAANEAHQACAQATNKAKRVLYSYLILHDMLRR